MTSAAYTTAALTPATIDLETALYDLRNMANIAASVLEKAIGHSHEHITQNREHFHLTSRQRDTLLFAAYDVERRAQELVDAFNRDALS